MASGTTFVHDFAGVDLPVDAVLAAVSQCLTPESVQRLVSAAWSAEAAVLAAPPATNGHGDTHGHGVVDVSALLRAEAGPPRVRRDAMVIPVSWMGAERVGLPPLESDVEFTSFGDDRTHVHLYGRAKVSEVAPPGSRQANLASRVAVAVVRRFLADLAADLHRTASAARAEHAAPARS